MVSAEPALSRQKAISAGSDEGFGGGLGLPGRSQDPSQRPPSWGCPAEEPGSPCQRSCPPMNIGEGFPPKLSSELLVLKSHCQIKLLYHFSLFLSSLHLTYYVTSRTQFSAATETWSKCRLFRLLPCFCGDSAGFGQDISSRVFSSFE